MVLRSAVIALLLLSIVGTDSDASAQTPPPNADDLQMVDCQLPPQIRRMGGITRIIPGRKVRTTKVDCDTRFGLIRARKSIETSLAGLHAVQCGEARCYSSIEVAGALSEIRERVRRAIPRQAEALALAVDADLERASQPASPLPLNPVQAATLRPDNATNGYRTNAVADWFRRMTEVIDHVLSYETLTLTLVIRSEPSAADFKMDAGGVDITKRHGTTNMHLPNVWRGRYAFDVWADCCKTGSLAIDLMNDSKTRIVCKLASKQEAAKSHCCQLDPQEPPEHP